MKNWNLLVVEDETPARERMRRLLSAHGDIEVAEVEDGAQAMRWLDSHEVHIMLLDVQLPDVSGLEILQRMKNVQPPVTILVTASRAHALDAFEFSAIDYLLKPVENRRLDVALDRARKILTALQDQPVKPALEAGPGALPQSLARILVRSGMREQIVRVEHILWVEADGNYVNLHCVKEKHFIRENIGKLEQMLPSSQFVRVNRSALVNIESIVEIRHSGKAARAVLTDGSELPLTCAMRELRDRMQFGGG
ncbi:LytR/AlgR family response regulator transcription factor [Verrucomicrobium spinosum]|uniref:LytR/AlgR family response regulator transcription factor n=1 Tax=Verrucomicrobium spinosum TaxID=2736 RepID=UPI0001746AD6|nr:LytTR family DNA-binding domain-containing protein [Verrucomicrobium spinosum]